MIERFQEVVVTGPNQVELRAGELDLTCIDPHHVIIETDCTIISSGTEIANYTGKAPKVFQKGSWCAYPWRSGYANVGTVRALGKAVTRTHVGERVFTFANHASLVSYNVFSRNPTVNTPTGDTQTEERLIFPIPPGMDSGIAVSACMAWIAATALLVSKLENDPWVVVFGLGMVGNLAAQIYQLRGFRVIGVDPLPSRCELARQCGIFHTVASQANAVIEQVKQITNGAMGGIVVEAVGHSAVALQALRATATLGQLVLLGTPRVPVPADLTQFLSDVHLRGIVVRGALTGRFSAYPDAYRRPSHYGTFQMIFDWIQRGLLKLEPLISHRLPPGRIVEAYNGLRDHPEIFTGVVLDWRRRDGP